MDGELLDELLLNQTGHTKHRDKIQYQVLAFCLVFSSCECQKFDPDLKKFIGPPDEPFRVPSTRSFVSRSGWVTRVPNTRETAT